MTEDSHDATGAAVSEAEFKAPAIAPKTPPSLGEPESPESRQARTGRANRRGSWLPTWSLITTKHLELRKRRGLVFVVLLLTLGLPFVVLGIRLLFHAVDPHSYGPAGSPSVFQDLCNPMAEFGFIIAATLGTTAGTTDLTEGVFRHLVITGRSRLALYLARIPAGLSILLPLTGVAFAALCLVTAYAGTPQPAAVNQNGISIPIGFNQAQLETWLLQHPQQAEQAVTNGPVIISPESSGGSVVVPKGISAVPPSQAQIRRLIEKNISTIYSTYIGEERSQLNPADNEMTKIGLWLELEVTIGFLVGLGLGSLLGQRTVSTILMIVLEIILTPILAATAIPYFLNGQRLVVGVAMDQLRPAALASGVGGHGGGRVLFGGRALGIPPMPTWAMIAVIVGWIVGWSVIGAWRMMTRDA